MKYRQNIFYYNVCPVCGSIFRFKSKSHSINRLVLQILTAEFENLCCRGRVSRPVGGETPPLREKENAIWKQPALSGALMTSGVWSFPKRSAAPCVSARATLYWQHWHFLIGFIRLYIVWWIGIKKQRSEITTPIFIIDNTVIAILNCYFVFDMLLLL